MSYFSIEILPVFDYVKAPGERFELSFPCENALYGFEISRRAPYQARRPRHTFSPNRFLENQYIIDKFAQNHSILLYQVDNDGLFHLAVFRVNPLCHNLIHALQHVRAIHLLLVPGKCCLPPWFKCGDNLSRNWRVI